MFMTVNIHINGIKLLVETNLRTQQLNALCLFRNKLVPLQIIVKEKFIHCSLPIQFAKI